MTKWACKQYPNMTATASSPPSTVVTLQQKIELSKNFQAKAEQSVKSGDKKAAIDFYSQAIQYDDCNSGALDGRAKLYKDLGKREAYHLDVESMVEIA